METLKLWRNGSSRPLLASARAQGRAVQSQREILSSPCPFLSTSQHKNEGKWERRWLYFLPSLLLTETFLSQRFVLTLQALTCTHTSVYVSVHMCTWTHTNTHALKHTHQIHIHTHRDTLQTHTHIHMHRIHHVSYIDKHTYFLYLYMHMNIHMHATQRHIQLCTEHTYTHVDRDAHAHSFFSPSANTLSSTCCPTFLTVLTSTHPSPFLLIPSPSPTGGPCRRWEKLSHRLTNVPIGQ